MNKLLRTDAASDSKTNQLIHGELALIPNAHNGKPEQQAWMHPSSATRICKDSTAEFLKTNFTKAMYENDAQYVTGKSLKI